MSEPHEPARESSREPYADELPELANATSFLEIGCGIGSTVAPLRGNCRAPHLDFFFFFDGSEIPSTPKTIKEKPLQLLT